MICGIAGADHDTSDVIRDGHAFDFETLRQVDVLVKLLGGLPECKRLGFVAEDEQGVIGLSRAGLGYLLYVRARDITNAAEAFAAGYECASDALD